jgi:hypothetical protein
MGVGRKRKADASLIVALACGSCPENAAQKSGLSVRTVYRRLKEPSFLAQVQHVHADIVRRTTSMLSASGLAAVKTFTTLQESATSESVRLRAARAILELGCKMRETVELMERMAALEAQLETLLKTLLGDTAAPDGAGDPVP